MLAILRLSIVVAEGNKEDASFRGSHITIMDSKFINVELGKNVVCARFVAYDEGSELKDYTIDFRKILLAIGIQRKSGAAIVNMMAVYFPIVAVVELHYGDCSKGA